MDGPLPKWCPAVALSRQDDRHSAVVLLLKAALIQVSDYRLLGASGLSLYRFVTLEIPYCFQIHTQNYFKYFYHRPVNVYLRFKIVG